MALDTSKVTLPRSVVTQILEKAHDNSVIAALSPATPQVFADQDYLVFSGSSEAEVVAEGAAKGSYEQSLSTVTGVRRKIVTTTRVTSELRWADEDDQLQIISAIRDDQTKALSRALDLIVFHGLNPKLGTVLDGATPLSTSATQVTATTDASEDLDSLVDALAAEHDINGVAVSPTYAAELRKIRVKNTGARLYPEIPLGLDAGSIDGIRSVTSRNVDAKGVATAATNVKAFIGDWSQIRWGMVRDITSEIIEFGDPDGTGVDLKHNNQIAYRTEAVLSYAVIDPTAFAVLKTAVTTG